ncbi:hypothetical protein FB45DRAFT_1036380 [Roridomyces roridus]|uniref:Uncharacterized protein n=1 Tax=Roridomyces roridus TaxID=1738132 RepID=A0AAD7FB68_9AGAR|nr:hypothetical protein FB45DRAFT_1036380 [Roridomyces roridus]
MTRGSARNEIHARSVTLETQDSADSTLLGKPRPRSASRDEIFSSTQPSFTVFTSGASRHPDRSPRCVAAGWEHRVVFSADHELFVARLVKGVLTPFITLYCALLVFVMQSLALRRDLHKRQLLTAMHDNADAWSGLGSAIVRLWQQWDVPASPIGVLSALSYLASILVLHTAFPGVAAPQFLLVNQSVPISTQSLPAFDLSGVNANNRQALLNAAGQYAGASLSFLPFLTPINTLGLHEATLYDVIGPNAGTGSVRVNATGFNISCGYIPDTAYNTTAQSINVSGTEYFLGIANTDVITTVGFTPESQSPISITFPSPAVFYTTIPVLDSNNNTAPWINLNGFGAQAVQVFRCSHGLVEQTVFVDAQSHNLTSDTPSIEKGTSTWVPFSGQLDDLSTAAFSDGKSGFLDIWEGWYSVMPEAEAPPLLSAESTNVGLSVADMALLQQLQLYPFNTTLRNSVYLHEVENQLAKIVASMFWTLGHAPTTSASTSLAQPFNVSLLAGQAVVSGPMIQNRLDFNIISIVQCLVASLVLLALSLRFSCLGPREAHTTKTKIDSLDVLQSIWLYRDHPELAASLEQVQVPTDLNLRRAGMMRVQLIDGTAPMREMLKEFGEMSEDADVSLSETKYPPGKQGSKERERRGSTWKSDLVLSLVSTILHSGLVLIHLILAVLCGMGLEHRITFSLSQQSFVAWLISTLATVFITIYTAGLLFLTQTLSIKHNLRKTQTLTVTHDTVAAWRGIGSALTSMCSHTPSLSAVFPVFMYLGGIFILHISSPGLLTVQTFNSTLPAPVQTQSIPNFAFSGYDPSSIEARLDPLHSPLLYARGTFFYLPFVNSSSPTLGLEGGTLYGVLSSSDPGSATSSGLGTAIVDSVQLNMTCGYFADPVVNFTSGKITILGLDYTPAYTDIGIISTLQYVPDGNSVPANFSADNVTGSPFTSSALFYSTVPISDSAGNTGPLVDISGIQGLDGVAKIQIFGCSLSLVNGSVTVDSQSRLLSNEQAVQKDSSVWSPFQSTKAESKNAYDVLVNDWDSWYIAMPDSNSPQIVDQADSEITVAEVFFMERFNLNSTGSSVTLHQFEDALAELVASMYWTLGHIPPIPGFAPASLEPNGPPPVEVSLLRGNAVFLSVNFEATLDANMSFIILGMGVSAVLFLLALQFSVFRNPSRDEEVISGMGPLHIIWLYRNHPELEAELKQVINPTTAKLREAGMVPTRLAGLRAKHFIW